MIRGLIIFLAGALAIYLITSCSVQKRRYTRGFYVSGPSKKHKTTAAQQAVHEKTELSSFSKNIEKEVTVAVEPTTAERQNMTVTSELPVLPAAAKTDFSEKKKNEHLPANGNTFKSLSRLMPLQKTSSKPARPVLVFALLGFVLAILSVVAILLAFILLLATIESAVSVLLAAVVMVFLSLLFCIIAIINKILDPISTGLWMAIVGLVISSLLLAIGYAVVGAFQ